MQPVYNRAGVVVHVRPTASVCKPDPDKYPNTNGYEKWEGRLWVMRVLGTLVVVC